MFLWWPCCSAVSERGIVDAGASISVGGKHIGNWLIGQVRDETQTEESIRAYAREIGADEDAMAAAFHDIPFMSREKFGHLARMLHTLAGQLSSMAYLNLQQARFIAERKRAEQILEVQERKYSQIFNSTNEAIFIHDLKTGAIEDVNDSMLRMYGYESREDVLLANVDAFSVNNPPFTKEGAYALLQKAIQEGPQVFEWQAKKRDGTIFWVEVSLRYSEIDGYRRVLAVVRDISERKCAEEELQKSQTMLQLVLDTIPQFICWKDRNSRFLGCNRNYAKMIGLSDPQAIVGKTDWDLPWTKEETEFFIETDKRLMDSGQAQFNIIEPALDANGVQKWLETSKVPLHDAAGKVSGILVAFEDITERKHAENALSESEEKFRRIVVASPMAMYFYRLEPGERLILIGANPAADHILGIDHNTLLGKTIEEAFPNLTTTDIPALYRRVARGEVGPQSFEITYKQDGVDGTYNVGVFKTADNTIAVNFFDISERKRAEEEKLILERQVQHAQKFESLGVLAGGIAHDFNNLLMAILGNADLALDALSPLSPAKANIEELEKAAKRAAELAKQMLAYSGKGRFVIEPIDIGKLVEEMAHLLVVSISKKVTLKFNFAENILTFDGDATQIRQVIMNLITNASEAIGDKTGVIALSTGVMECDRAYLDSGNEILRITQDGPLPEGLYTYIEVTDTGCGMDAQTIDKIFDPFFTTKFTGRGLGMSAVLGIVRGHRGVLKIYSELGKGTCFKILFPVSDQGDKSHVPSNLAETDPKSWRGMGTILITDDEESVRTVGRQMLERMGFTVLTAEHGHEAISVFQQHAREIVCVLLDLTMPHMDGEETFRELRSLNTDVKVVLCSGYNEQDAVQRFTGKGLAGFLQKPYTLRILREKLHEIL